VSADLDAEIVPDIETLLLEGLWHHAQTLQPFPVAAALVDEDEVSWNPMHRIVNQTP